MCITFVYISDDLGSRYKLIILNNRDESYDRPTLELDWRNGILGGTDIQDPAKGTWFAANKKGRVGILLSIAQPVPTMKSGCPSRGIIAKDYLSTPCTTKQFFGDLSDKAHLYNGFQFLGLEKDYEGCYNMTSLTSMYVDEVKSRSWSPGTYVFGNSPPEKPYRKVVEGKKLFEKFVSSLNNETEVDDIIERLLIIGTDKRQFFPDPQMALQSGRPPEWYLHNTSIMTRFPLEMRRYGSVLADKEPAMKLLLLLIFAICHVSHAYKILVYSAPLGYSHMQFMGRIADILQEAGHDVTVLHPIWCPKYLYAVSKLAKQVLFDLPLRVQKALDPKNLRVWELNSKSIVQQLGMFSEHTALQMQSCEYLLSDNHTIELLTREHFDAGITELIAGCGYGLFNKLGIGHMISASALGLVDSMAEFYDAPRFPSFVPSFLLPVTDKMNFMERVINFITSCIAKYVEVEVVRSYKNIFERHGVSTNVEEYYSKSNYLLSNSDEFLEFARPLTHKIVHLGGIALAEKQPLTQEIQELVQRKDRVGVIYISFGSVVPTIEMPAYFRETIYQVARSLPTYTFIWKSDPNDTFSNIANLHRYDWVPQQALLEHPNLRCFVSHAGLNSVLETSRSGKPSILVPIFGDQFRNARLAEAKNTTIVLMKESFNYNTFRNALNKILNDKSFTLRAAKLASLMINKPFSIRDRLLQTVEFSIQHGKIENLDVYGRNLNALQYYSIDVIASLIAILALTIYTTAQLWWYLIRRLIVIKLKID
ncbi:unnamed protein product [Cylicocyclus nassatus]|uniref:glucuronosyltransferase n=1 Tax=Cylicocyclus nassatus TaxID=53992 RepID=A0AA36GC68_CYLNA|nr:unnamed protein product [Cylicocyclus nassatus]